MLYINSLFQTIDKEALNFKTEIFAIEEDNSIGEQIVKVLKSFKVSVEHMETEVGPVITSIYVKPNLGVRVTDVEVLDDDLCVALGVDSINIQKAPEKKAISIEIPTVPRKKIPFGNILYSNTSNKILPAALGIDTRGNPINIDITDTPHLLIAGQTGSGKSVCLNTIITSLALNATPSDLQFLLIDPKRVEFSLYNDLPNLIGGHVINEIDEAMQSLQWLIQEMERRNSILAKSKCRKLSDFKQKLMIGDVAEIPKELADNIPYIVVVIDEYADLMMRSEKELTECIMKLAQKARNVGIHLILATQRPSSKILTGDIKANIPTRIALKVASSVDSKTIIDHGGAEKLLGKGDIILKDTNGKERRIHGCFLSDDEIKKSVDYLKESFKDNIFRFNQPNVFDTPSEQYEKEVSQHGALGEIANACTTKIDEAGKRDDLAEWLCEIKDIFENKLQIQIHPKHISSIVNSRDNIFAQALIWAFYNYTDEFGNHPLAKKIVQEAFNNENSIEYKFITTSLGENEEIDEIFSSIVIEKISEATDSKIDEEKTRAYSWLQLLKHIFPNWNKVDGIDELIYAHPEIFKDIIIEWWLCDKKETAYWTIFENPDIFKDTIIEELKEGSHNAMTTIIENISVFEDVFDESNMDFIANRYPELFDKLIQQNNKYAKAIVYKNPQEYQNIISDLARNGDNQAKDSICDYLFDIYISMIDWAEPEEIIRRLTEETWSFENLIIEWAKNGDSRLDFVAYISHYRTSCFINKIIREAKDYNYFLAEYVIENELEDFDEEIAEMIKNGDKWARRVVEKHFDSCEIDLSWESLKDNESHKKNFNWSELFFIKSCIIDLWEMNDEWSESIIQKHPRVFRELILEWAMKDKNPNAERTIRKNPQIFKNEAFSNPKIFSKTIIIWAIKNNDVVARDFVCDNLELFKNLRVKERQKKSEEQTEKNIYDLVAAWATEGLTKAQKLIHDNPSIFFRKISECANISNKCPSIFIDYIRDWAMSGDKNAKNFALNNALSFRNVIETLAISNDETAETAKNIVYDNPQVFRKLIDSWAKQGDEKAKKIIDEQEIWNSILPEELWKKILQSKGLTDDQMSLRIFQFVPYLHSHMTKENMEAYAESLIIRAKI